MGRRKRNRAPQTAGIVSATHDGRGIANCEGKKVFVAGALPGETVEFARRKFRRNFDEAELLSVVQASPDRIEPKCAVYGRCGGCSLQHMSIARQQEIKFDSLKNSLERLGGVSPSRWLDTLSGDGWAYRRRARLAVKAVAGKGRVLVGFRERHAPFVTDMHTCEVLSDAAAALIDPLSTLIDGLSIRSSLPQVEVAVADNALALVFRVLEAPADADRVAMAEFAENHDLRLYLQPAGLDTVRLEWPEAVDRPLFYSLPESDIEIEFEPTDFIQVNGGLNRRMVERALDLLQAEADEHVLDLYCGIGNFSLPLARRCASVVGIEGEPSLVARATANARLNSIDNARFISRDLDSIDTREEWVRKGCDRLLLDPARSGAAELVRNVECLAPLRIVYVSCHPGTLARDAGVLVNEKGYRLASAGIIDMFPHTAHVESIAVFDRE